MLGCIRELLFPEPKMWYVSFSNLYEPLTNYHRKHVCVKGEWATWPAFEEWLLKTYSCTLERPDLKHHEDQGYQHRHSIHSILLFRNEADYLAFKIRWL